MALSPRESGKFITDNSTDITINKDGLEKLGKMLSKDIESNEFSMEKISQKELHPSSEDPNAMQWIFVVDTLNFCFWSKEDEPGWTVEGHTGYFALCAAINRALKENIDILNTKYFSKISIEDLKKIFRSDNHIEIPLLEKRKECLHEVGNSLLENFEGLFENVVRSANHSAKELLSAIVEHFPCFRDEADYSGRRVGIYKRAQILIGDIWACYRGKDLGEFTDIENVTMFADYRIPQSLLYHNVMTYSKDLNDRLLTNEPLHNGHKWEVEIRGASIHAVDLLVDEIRKHVTDPHSVNAILLDHYLWDFRRQNADQIIQAKIPFHKTFSVYY